MAIRFTDEVEQTAVEKAPLTTGVTPTVEPQQQFKSRIKFTDIEEQPQVEPKDNSWDTLRGLEVSMRQVPQLAYGVAGLVGDTAEKLTGYGESMRDWGFRGYKDWGQTMEPISKETDDVTVAWQKAKEGDVGALVDWAQYGIGYALGQLGETAAVAVLGGLAGGAAGAAGGPTAVPAAAGGAVVAAAGKQGFKAIAKNLIEKAIANQAAKIVTRQAEKEGIELTAEQIAKQASQAAIKKEAAKEIGSNAAILSNAVGMQLGSIYGSAEEQARAEGRELTGIDLAKIWGSGLATGGLEGITDKLGLDLLKGKFAKTLPAGRLAGAAVAGGVGTIGEAATEAVQTVGERFGAGKDILSEEAINEYINAAALGGIGGGVIGGAGGFISGNPKENAAAKAKVSSEANKDIAPASAETVARQADAVIAETVQETPEQKVARLEAEATAAAGIELEEEGGVGVEPTVPVTPPVAPTPEGAVAPVEPVVTPAVAEPQKPAEVAPAEPVAAEPAPATERPIIAPETLNPRGKQAVKILTSVGVDEETASYVASRYQDEAGEMGAEEWRDFIRNKFEENGGVIPQAMGWSEDPKYYQAAFNVSPEEAATMAENGRYQNQQIAQNELEQNKKWRRKDEEAAQAQRGIAEAAPEVKAGIVPTGGVAPSPAIEGRGVPLPAAAPTEVAIKPKPPQLPPNPQFAPAEVEPQVAAQKAIDASRLSGRRLGIGRASESVEQAREVAYEAKQEASLSKTPVDKAIQIWEAAGNETKYGEPEFASSDLSFAVSGGYDKATNEVKLTNNPREFSSLTGDAALTPRSVVRHELGHWALFNAADNDLVRRLFEWADTADRTQILDPWHGGRAGIAYPKTKFDSRDELVSEAYSIWKSGGTVPESVVPMLQELDALVPEQLQNKAIQFADSHATKLGPTPAPEVRESRREPAPLAQQDREYLDAVERGDLDAASSVTENIAKSKRNFAAEAYHGVGLGRLEKNRFDVSKRGTGAGGIDSELAFFLSKKKGTADIYAGIQPRDKVEELADQVDSILTDGFFTMLNATPVGSSQQLDNYVSLYEGGVDPFAFDERSRTWSRWIDDAPQDLIDAAKEVLASAAGQDPNVRNAAEYAIARANEVKQIGLDKPLTLKTFLFGRMKKITANGSYNPDFFYNQIEKAWNEGYDILEIANVDDGAGFSDTIYAVRNPEQIKSADPVTYDDRGNIIPPSQRFQPTEEDIRYSLAERGQPKESQVVSIPDPDFPDRVSPKEYHKLNSVVVNEYGDTATDISKIIASMKKRASAVKEQIYGKKFLIKVDGQELEYNTPSALQKALESASDGAIARVYKNGNNQIVADFEDIPSNIEKAFREESRFARREPSVEMRQQYAPKTEEEQTAFDKASSNKVLARSPQLAVAAVRMKNGEITAGEYADLVDAIDPFTAKGPDPIPTNEKIYQYMSKTMGASPDTEEGRAKLKKIGAVIPSGKVVEFRIDIPTYNESTKAGDTVYAVTAHEPVSETAKQVGKTISHVGIAKVTNPTFINRAISGKGTAVVIAAGAGKFPLATVKGNYEPITELPADINDPNVWTEVGYNPIRSSFFVDVRSKDAVVGGSEAIMVGSRVFVKDAVLEPRPTGVTMGERYARIQMPRPAGMKTEAVATKLESLGFGRGGIVSVVNEPDASFEGRTIIRDGKVVGIELNAAALKDDAAVERVLNHEIAESANADGALNNLIAGLTPKERKEINDAITRLGYAEKARTAEEAARAVELLAEGWRGRRWFERAVARIEAWANKLGYKLTRRAAEYIAAKNMAEVNDAFRKWSIADAMANLKGARKVSFNGLSAVLIPPSEMEFAYSIAAYHGTPHDIKGGFQLKYVGTGEGAQAFGWGLYFAENPTVARYYREKLSQGTIPTLDQQLPEIGKSISREAFDFLKGYEDIDAAIQGLRDTASSDSPMIRRAWAGRENELEELNQKYREAADWIEKNKTRLELKRDDGNLYSVEINAEQDEFIDWDNPLSEQSEIIQKALQPFRTDFYDLSVARGTDKESGATAYERIAFALGSREAASRRLFESGIKGVRYLDGTSRGKGAGSNNYVVFDDSLITITARNGEPVDIRESRREDAIPTFSEGSPEASTLATMASSMAKVDAASEAKPNPENKPTYKISEIASVWMDQGGDTRQLQDMVVEYTNLTPANAKRVANAIAKQYDIQQSIAEAQVETAEGISLEGLPEGVSIPKEADPKRPKTVIQRLIDVTTGVRVPPVKITATERSLLNNQIRMRAAANREAKKAQQETANDVVEIIKSMELRGPVRPKQAQALAKRAAKVIWTSEKSMESFMAYAEKVVANTNYDADLREAKAAQKRALELSKRSTVASPQQEILANIAKIGVNMLDNPREFAEVVNYYMRGFKPVPSPDYLVVPDDEITSYLSQAEDIVEEAKMAFDRVVIERLSEKYGVSPDRIQEILDAQDIERALVQYAKREVAEAIINERANEILAGLKAYDQTNLRADQRKIIDSILKLDPSLLSSQEKQQFVRTGNNIIFNNQTHGAELFAVTAKGQQMAKEAASNEDLIAKNTAWVNVLPSLRSRTLQKTWRNWALELQSVADTFRNAFGKGAMAKVYRMMGMYDLDRGFTAAANTVNQIQEEIAAFYNNLEKKYKAAARNQDGILAEGIVGFLIQRVPEKGEIESLAQRRNLIQQDIRNRRISQDADRIAMADRIERILQQLDGESVSDIMANLKRDYRASYESVIWLKNTLFPKYKEFLKRFDENFNDQANNYENPDYLPIGFIRAGVSLAITPENEAMYYEHVSLRPKQSSYTIKRADYTQLPTDKTTNKPKEIEFNLRRNAFDSLSDQINKAYTSPAWQQIFAFMKTPESEKLFGGAANKEFFIERLNRLRLSRMRRGSMSTGYIEKTADALSVMARKLGTGIALGGFYQPFKQAPDQIIAAIGTTGRSDLMAENMAPSALKAAKVLLDKFSIGRRGDASSGYKYINQMEGAQNKIERYLSESKWDSAKEQAGKIADTWLFLLKKTDYAFAAGAWMTYYRAQLAKDGVKFQGWEQEARLLDTDTARQDAAAYAEQMTDIYQGSSDPTKMATFVQSGKSGWENLFKAIFVPFNSFAVQQRMRIYSDARDAFTKSGDRAAGGIGLAATVGGLLAFHSVRRFALPALTGLGVSMLYAAFGVDMDEPDEEKKAEDFAKRWRQFLGEFTSNLLVGGAGQIVESATIDSFNYAAYLIAMQTEDETVLNDKGEIISFSQYAKERSPFWRYRSFDNAMSLGMFDIGIDQGKKAILETKTLMTPEEMENFTTEEQRLLYFAALSDWLYLMRLNDADFSRMVDKARRDIKARSKETEKELARIRAGR